MSNNMLDILKNFDAAEAGEKPAAGAENVNDMKAILESIQSVEECSMEGAMPATPAEPEEKVSMNVTLNARGDAVEELIALMGGKKETPHMEPDGDEMPMKMQLPMPKDNNDDMAKMLAAMDQAQQDEDAIVAGEDIEVDEWDNSPDEEYSDHEVMIKDLSGGLNREKKSYKPTNGGDNPMALEQTIKEQLLQALAEKKKS